MANYRHALDKVLAHEGGYVNDPDDKGGETYKGITRPNFPDWSGWKIIDAERHVAGFPKNLKSVKELNDSVADFYKHEFWDKIKGDLLNNQDVADLLVDIAVNQGVRPAVKRAQLVAGQEQTGKFTEGLVDSINLLA